MTDSDQTVLVIQAQSATWRRRLGPLAWAVLEHLALAAHPDPHGWAAAIGVRDIGKGIGVTKDTAAGAVTTLAGFGLVTRQHVNGLDGRQRSGYRLHLPDGIRLQTWPTDQDGAPHRQLTERCPTNADKGTCPANQDSAPAAESGAKPRRPGQPGRRRLATALAARSTLFDPATAAPAESWSDLSRVDPRSEDAIHDSRPPEEVGRDA